MPASLVPQPGPQLTSTAGQRDNHQLEWLLALFFPVPQASSTHYVDPQPRQDTGGRFPHAGQIVDTDPSFVTLGQSLCVSGLICLVCTWGPGRDLKLLFHALGTYQICPRESRRQMLGGGGVFRNL